MTLKPIVLLMLLSLAGCLGNAPASGAKDIPSPTTDPGTTWRTASSETTVEMPSSFCVAYPPTPCVGVLIAGGDDRAHFLPMVREARNVVVEAEWTPSSPLTQQLRLYAAPSRDCGEMCYELVGPVVNTTGPSPLRLDYPAPLDGARDVVFWLRSIDHAPVDAHIETSTGQEVRVRMTWEEPA